MEVESWKGLFFWVEHNTDLKSLWKINLCIGLKMVLLSIIKIVGFTYNYVRWLFKTAILNNLDHKRFTAIYLANWELIMTRHVRMHLIISLTAIDRHCLLCLLVIDPIINMQSDNEHTNDGTRTVFLMFRNKKISLNAIRYTHTHTHISRCREM